MRLRPTARRLSRMFAVAAAVVASSMPAADAKTTALVMLSRLTQSYDATPRAVVATTLPANLKVRLQYDGSPEAPILPGKYPVSATIDDPEYTGAALDLLTINVTALVRHAPQIDGGVDGSVWVLRGDPIVLAGSGWISGDLFVPGTPALLLDDLPMIAGTLDETGAAAPSGYAVTLGGTSIIRYLIRRFDPVLVAPVPRPPMSPGTRDVTLDQPTDAPGEIASIGNLVLNGTAGAWSASAGTYNAVVVNDGATLILGEPGAKIADVYNLQQLTLNGSGRLKVAGPVLLVVANGFSVGETAGDPNHPGWLTVAVSSGGVTLNRGAMLAGNILAPAGTISIGRDATLLGEVTSDGLVIETGGVLADPR